MNEHTTVKIDYTIHFINHKTSFSIAYVNMSVERVCANIYLSFSVLHFPFLLKIKKNGAWCCWFFFLRSQFDCWRCVGGTQSIYTPYVRVRSRFTQKTQWEMKVKKIVHEKQWIYVLKSGKKPSCSAPAYQTIYETQETEKQLAARTTKNTFYTHTKTSWNKQFFIL